MKKVNRSLREIEGAVEELVSQIEMGDLESALFIIDSITTHLEFIEIQIEEGLIE